MGPNTAVIGDIEQFLVAALVEMEPLPAVYPHQPRGRPRILPALALWGGLLVCVLQGWTTQSALWRLLTQRQLWFFPRFTVSDQAVYHRLERDGAAPLERVFAHITQVLRERLAPFMQARLASFATEVIALDQVKLDQVARSLPALQGVPAGDDRLLPGAFGVLFDVRRQQFRTVEYHADPHQNEKVAARDLAATLPHGSLVLADLGYFSFPWFDWLHDHGLWWISRLRAKTSYTVRHIFYQQDGVLDALVDLGAYRADRAAYRVRLVAFRVGAKEHRYLTSVLDPRLLPIRDIAQLYARRWDIEMAFNLLKTHLGLHLLWSAKPVVILQQVWAALVIAQVLQALRVEIAGRAGVDVFDVSLPLLVQYAPQYGYDGKDPVAAFVEHGRAAGFIRPSRRIRLQVPEAPPEAIIPLPAGLGLERTPRYAGRKAGSRTSAKDQS